MTGKPILVFENLDVKIASGLRKIQIRNFKKHFTTDKCKAQSENGSLTSRHIAWMIHDLFKIRGEHGAILDFRDSSKVSWGQTCNRRALSKRKRERKCQKNNSEGDCIRWITTGQCSFGEACAFKHDPNQKGKGKGRPRSPSPTGSPHRHSKGDGKGSDDRGAKDTAQLTGKSLSVKANRLLCTKLKTGSCQMSDSCSCWHVPESAKFKAPGGCKFGGRCAHKTHSKTCWWTVKFRIDCYSHFIEWWLTDVITESSVGWQDPISSETSASREQVRSHKGEIKTCSGSHPDWTSKSATSKMLSIE